MATKTSGKGTPNVPAQRQNTSIAPINYGKVGAVGLEKAGRDDFAIPFFQIIQKLSPQMDRRSPLFMKEAKEGMIMNSASGELFPADEGILFVPCFYRSAYVAWVIREKGGGFRGEYERGDPVVMSTKRDDRGREMLPGNEGVQLVDTRIFGGLQIGEGGKPTPGILTMSSTQLKKSKRWVSQMDAFQLAEKSAGSAYPIFAHAYRMTTVGESNEKGNWEGWAIQHEGLLHEAIKGEAHVTAFEAAKAFYKSLASGESKLRADNDAEQHTGAGAGSDRM